MKRISKSKFRALLQEADATNNLQSYIGYPETARLIEELTGVEIQVSREPAELATGDVMLIVKLRHRVPDPANKITYHPSMDDFDFFISYWRPLAQGDLSK